MKKLPVFLISVLLLFGVWKYFSSDKKDSREPERVSISNDRAKIEDIIDCPNEYVPKGSVAVLPERERVVKNGIAFFSFTMTIPSGLSAKEVEWEIRCALSGIYDSPKYIFRPVLIDAQDGGVSVATGIIRPDRSLQNAEGKYKPDELKLDIFFNK